LIIEKIQIQIQKCTHMVFIGEQ